MSTAGAERFVVGLIALFDRDASTETVKVYVACLQEHNDEDLDAAMSRVYRRCRFFPSVAEILECVDEAREERAERERTSRPRLPEPEPDPERRRAGLEHVRSALKSAGVLAPPRISREKLSTAERRHDVHEKLGPRVPDVCRFCRELEDGS